MEKLLIYLREYVNTLDDVPARSQHIEHLDRYFNDKWWLKNYSLEAEIISKRFWFINWLVGNKKLKEPHWDFYITWNFELDYETLRPYDSDYWYMVLSVQKEPIDYLLSFIK